IEFIAEKPEGVLALALARRQTFKTGSLLVAGAELQKYMQKIAHKQELIMYIADMLIETYVAESTILRVQKLYNIQKDAKYIEEKIKIAQLYTYDAGLKIQQWGTQAIASFAEGDEARMMQMALRRFTKADPINTIAVRREIADKVIEENAYCYS